jgi:hypothetical protein
MLGQGATRAYKAARKQWECGCQLACSHAAW